MVNKTKRNIPWPSNPKWATSPTNLFTCTHFAHFRLLLQPAAFPVRNVVTISCLSTPPCSNGKNKQTLTAWYLYNKLKANGQLITVSRLFLNINSQEEVLDVMEVRPPGISITLPVGLTRQPGPLYLAREAKLLNHRFNSPDKATEVTCPAYTSLCEWFPPVHTTKYIFTFFVWL